MNAMTEMQMSSNATELLTHDHREVENIILALQGLKGSKDSSANTPNADFIKLDENLTLHALAEENVFYPELKNYTETASLIPEAYTEHQGVKDLLAKMRGLAPNSDDFQSSLEELKADLQHHVSEEENEMFVKAREVLGEQRLEELGRQIQQFKDREKQNMTGGMSASATGSSRM